MAPRVTARQLKDRLRRRSEVHGEATRIRLHRAISWLLRAEGESRDHDAAFLFLWIAFNAAYAQEVGSGESSRSQLAGFFARLLELDAGKRLHALLFERYSGPLRILIENQYVFEPFWRALREHDASGQWRRQFKAGRQKATRAILLGDTATVLGIVFDRLYVLRNQLVHGGATWNGSVNRAQVRDGANLLRDVVPEMLELMLDHPEADFGPIQYPVLPD